MATKDRIRLFILLSTHSMSSIQTRSKTRSEARGETNQFYRVIYIAPGNINRRSIWARCIKDKLIIDFKLTNPVPNNTIVASPLTNPFTPGIDISNLEFSLGQTEEQQWRQVHQ